MAEVNTLVSADALMDRLAAAQLKHRNGGLPNHAHGLAIAICELMKLINETKRGEQPPSIDESD